MYIPSKKIDTEGLLKAHPIKNRGQKCTDLSKKRFVKSAAQNPSYIFCFDMIHNFYINIWGNGLTFSQDIDIIREHPKNRILKIPLEAVTS